ncbi:MAG: hypothetical protein INR66_19115 [Gordonia polyisoprenivorans]|nr:hypothetical protein [Gordonia polyisoprenivorans]
MADFARYGARVEVEIRLVAASIGQRPENVVVHGAAYSSRSGALLVDADLNNEFENRTSQRYKRRYYKRDIMEMVTDAEKVDK